MKRIVSVIVTYNRKQLLGEAIESLLNQVYKPYKVIIIDNASTDGTQSYLEERDLFKDNIKYVRLSSNMGGSAGFYFGIKNALSENADWVSLSDDDAIFDKNYFQNIVDEMNDHKDVKAFVGTVKTGGEIQVEHRRRVCNNVTLKQIPCDLTMYQEKEFNVDVFSFVGCVISTELMKKIGLPEKDYFIWMDDTEYSLRVRNNTKILAVSNAVINHKTSLAIHANYKPNWKEFYGFRNECFMILKHSNQKQLASLYVVLKLLRRILETLSQEKYKHYRKYRIKLILDVFKAVLLRKTGKNESYAPNQS